MKNIALALVMAYSASLFSTAAASAAGYWVPNGSRAMNPSSAGTICYYRWSSNLFKTMTLTIGRYDVCPVNP